MLVLSNGNRVVVEWVQHEILEAPVKVYNFEVEDFHTYFVLVHNECKKFYTVQNEADAERLRNGGAPWPTADTRAALGEGVYAWGNKADAEKYLSKIQERNPEARIIEFTIENEKLNNFKSINIDNLPDFAQEEFMNKYSRLYGGIPDHGYEYIQRGTNFGVEHFFSYTIFEFLNFL